MNDVQKMQLIDRLSKADLTAMIEIVKNDAEPVVILDAFKQAMLDRSEMYKNYVQRYTKYLPGEDHFTMVKDKFIRDEINKNPQYRLIYSMLQMPEKAQDCGCGGSKK